MANWIIQTKEATSGGAAADMTYAVSLSKDGDACNCKGYTFSRAKPKACKHIRLMKAVEASGKNVPHTGQIMLDEIAILKSGDSPQVLFNDCLQTLSFARMP